MVSEADITNQLTRDQTNLIRFLGIILITNSHLDSLYPLPQLATGGALGNALFFLISGYCLAQSYKIRPAPLQAWFSRRIMRIYPSVVIVTVFVDIVLHQRWREWTASEYFSALVWPTQFWFVGALMLFYLLIYFPLRLQKPGWYLSLIALAILPYAYFYLFSLDLSHYSIEGPSHFKWLFYFVLMLFGGYLGTRTIGFPQSHAYHLICLIASIMSYFTLGFWFSHGRLTHYQAIMHVLTIPIMYLALILTRTEVVYNKVMQHKFSRWVVTAVAGATLEIYLLQYYVYSNAIIKSLWFPVNVLVFATVLFGISVGLANISRRIRAIRL